MAGPVTVTCPTCGHAFAVPSEVVAVDPETDRVWLVMDRTELYGHQAKCTGKAVEAPKALPPAGPLLPKSELAGRIHLLLDRQAYVSTAGSRACTMCGETGAHCLEGLRKGRGWRHKRVPCCAACGVGNTHPAPGETWTCQQWAAEHGAKD